MKTYIGQSNKAILIMTGIGGSENGYKDKYLTIASNLNKKYGASIFIVSTPLGAWNIGEELVKNTINEITNIMNSNGKFNYQLYVMGCSAGASFVCSYTYEFPFVTKILAINPVIQVNYNKFLDGLDKSEAKIDLIFGTEDMSYKFVGLVERLNKTNIKITAINNADHYFSGEEDFNLFLNLPEKSFFDLQF